MRRVLLVLPAFLLSACHSDPDCASAGALDVSAYGVEAAAVAETDAFLSARLAEARAAGGWDARSLEAAARGLGLQPRELADAAALGCLAPDALSRAAAARGLSPETARAYLRARFGAGACAG